MNPLLTALVNAGVLPQADADRIDRSLDPEAARLYAEQRLTDAFANGLTAQQRRILATVQEAQGQPTPRNLERLWALEDDYLWAGVQDTLQSVAIDHATGVSINASNPNLWQLVNEEVVNWIDTRYTSTDADDFGSVPNLNVTTRQQVAEAIQRWQLGDRTPGNFDEGLPELINELTPIFGRARAERIAVTEVSRVFAQSELFAARANPDIVYLQWLTAEDELVCPICGPRANQVVGKKEDGFRAASDSILGYPPAHVNCRCSVTQLTKAAAEALRDGGNAGDVPPVAEAQAAEPTGTPPFKTGDQDFAPFSESRWQSADHNELNRLAEAWSSTLTEDQFVAVRRWTQNWHTTRDNIAKGNIGEAELTLLDALETAPKIEGLVYRGINPGGVFQSVQDVIDTYQRGVGTTINWDTLNSTTIVPDVAANFGNTVFEIKTKTARYINPVSAFYGKDDDEFEALIMPNTKFRIVGVGRAPIEFLDGPRDRWLIQLEEITG